MGAYSVLQLFTPTGVNATAGTPNFLRDLSNSVYQSQWTDMTQGGLATAQFDCRQDYTDDIDVVFGDYVLFGNWGCETNAPASSGATSIFVTNLQSAQYPVGSTFLDLQAGDNILITDGANTEFFKIQSITGSNPTWTVNIEAAGGTVLNMPSALLNNYSAGATVCRIVFYGYLTQRVHSTAFDNQFSINANGFFNRYGSFINNATVTGADGAAWLQKKLNQAAGQPYLTQHPGGGPWPVGTGTFGCDDTSALLVGEHIMLNSETFTIAAIHASAGTFDTTANSTATHATGTVVLPQGLSTAPFLPDIVVDNAFLDNSSIPINVQASDETLAEIIATVLRQETGSSKTLTYACWVDVLRQVHHTSINSVPPNYGETKLTTLATAGTGVSTPFQVANITQIKVGRRVFISGAAGADSLKVASVNVGAQTFKTTSNSLYNHPAGDKVVAIYDVTPSFTISQSDNGSGFGDTINKIQTTDMDGSQLINAAIITGTTQSNGQTETTLATPVSPPWGVYPNGFVCTSMPFEAGDVVNLSSGNQYGHLEPVTIASISGDTFYTTANCTKSHDSGSTIALASSNGPRIIIFEKDSIGRFGWYEGTISNDDIYTVNALSKWGYQQIEITAWPVINTAIDLDAASGRITARDLLGVIGFDDGIPFYVSVTQIQYQWLAATQSVTASITAGLTKSTAGSVLKELDRQHAIRERYKNNRKKQTNGDGHMGGADCLPNADNTFTINPATVKYGGGVFQTTSFAGTAPEGESWWGVDVSSGSGVIDLLPSTLINGRLVYAEAIYQATDDDGVGPTLVSSFMGIPLWRIEVSNGVIQGVWPLFATSGVGLGNQPSLAAPVQPTTSSATPSTTALANGIGSDLSVAVTFSNIPDDDQTHSIKYYLQTHGSSRTSHKFTRKIPGLPQPASATFSDTVVFHNVTNGIVVDVLASYESANGESTLATIVSNYTVTSGTLPRAMTDASITGAITSSSGITVNPFGSTSGVVVNAADGSLGGFPSGGASTVSTYPTTTSLRLYATVTLPNTSSSIELAIGAFSGSAFSVKIDAGGSLVSLLKYNSGTPSTVTSDALSYSANTPVNIRLAVDFAQSEIECVVEYGSGLGSTILLYTAQTPSGSSGVFSGYSSTAVISIRDSNSGTAKVQNLFMGFRDLYLAQNLLTQQVVRTSLDSNSSPLQHGIVYADQIAWSSGTPTGAVSLDSVPDGSSFKRIAAGDVTAANHVSKLFAAPWAAANVANDGSLTGFTSVTTLSTTMAFPVVASYTLEASAWISLGSTASQLFFIIGDDTNGIGIRWATSGVPVMLQWKAGVVNVLATLTTTTMDTNLHWYSVSVTPGATPGSSDVVKVYFDNLTSTQTTGASSTTWGSTAKWSVRMGTGAAAKMYFPRFHSTIA